MAVKSLLPGRRQVARLLLAGAMVGALAACSNSPSSRRVAATGPGALSGLDAQPAARRPRVVLPAQALSRQFPLTDPSSPWVVVNKRRPLKPLDYAPADLVSPRVPAGAGAEPPLLRAEAAAALEQLAASAAADGVTVTLLSSYRSYNTQVGLYSGYVAGNGEAEADTKSARPGYSEHQTGWALDIGDGGGACAFDPCFAEQPAAVWAAANAHRFGFLVRYQPEQSGITGYYAESWHLRYVGVELASDLVGKGFNTLEEYLGLEAAPGYSALLPPPL
jgi:zinc D-Ala-D-Ala carboxypeptidase